MDNSKALKKEIAYFMRRLYKRGLTTTSGGNISTRLPNGIVFITPSQTDKGRMKADEIAMVDMHARVLSTKLKPSMETGMHLAVYRTRNDINCIVHAHPPCATAYAAAHQNIDTSLVGEAYAIVGKPVLASYALMGSQELATIVAQAATNANVVLMANHGILAMGTSLIEAFDRLEVIESCARIGLNCRLLGGSIGLSNDQLTAIEEFIKP
jgi:L-fuculose-phosphate aldolase